MKKSKRNKNKWEFIFLSFLPFNFASLSQKEDERGKPKKIDPGSSPIHQEKCMYDSPTQNLI